LKLPLALLRDLLRLDPGHALLFLYQLPALVLPDDYRSVRGGLPHAFRPEVDLLSLRRNQHLLVLVLLFELVDFLGELLGVTGLELGNWDAAALLNFDLLDPKRRREVGG
jgi:hypothetical protein